MKIFKNKKSIFIFVIIGLGLVFYFFNKGFNCGGSDVHLGPGAPLRCQSFISYIFFGPRFFTL